MKTLVRFSMLFVVVILLSCGSGKKKELTKLLTEYEQLMETYFEFLQKIYNTETGEVIMKMEDMTRLQNESLQHTQKVTEWVDRWTKALEEGVTPSDAQDLGEEYQKIVTKWTSKIEDITP